MSDNYEDFKKWVFGIGKNGGFDISFGEGQKASLINATTHEDLYRKAIRTSNSFLELRHKLQEFDVSYNRNKVARFYGVKCSFVADLARLVKLWKEVTK